MSEPIATNGKEAAMHGLEGQPHVVIVGAGFAGLYAAQALRRSPVRVTIVDRQNYHKFQPLMYQVATSVLTPDDIVRNIRENFWKQKHISFRLGAVEAVDLDAQTIHTRQGTSIEYDYLIVATGSSTSYFGIEGAEEHALPLKELGDAVTMRDHILYQFERASLQPDLIENGVLNFVVGGAGPTGVETAGALVELFDVMQDDYPELDTARAKVFLVEMLDQVLPNYDEELAAYTERELERRGVDVRLGTAIERVERDAVHFKNGDKLPASTLIWATGVQGSPLGSELTDDLGKGGRVNVEADLSLPGHPEVFVAGDLAACPEPEGPHPQLAPVATQQGEHAARQILHAINGEPAEGFSYEDKGVMATIGRNAAVAELPSGLKLTGFIAWLAWLYVHVVKLAGFRNRLSVFVNWIYNYFTYDRATRIIMDMVPRTDEAKPLDEKKIP